MNFVSEKELKEQAGESKVDEPIDHRTLYERLKEVRDKAQAEKDEQFSLKNQFRGLDEDETDFLDKINQVKDNIERKRKEEENEILKQALKVDAAASTSSITISSLKLKMVSGNNAAKNQKEALKKLVVIKRKAPQETESPQEKQKKIETPVKIPEDKNPKKEAKEPIEKSGLLHGYSSSSDESG